MAKEASGEAATRDEPILCIEAGPALANDAVLSADERLLLTVGDDKTARLWSVPDLRPIGVLRPWIGPGPDEGRLNAAALSPDGTLAAVGGWGRGEFANVYIFDLARRAVVQVLVASLAGNATGLCFSHNGQLLAAGLSAGGILVWRTTDWSLAGEDPDCDNIESLDFASDDSRLAVGCKDGLRLYALPLQRIGCVNASGRWAQVRFSPDGRALAVGYYNGLVEVRAGHSLAIQTLPDTGGLVGDGAYLQSVAWSADGRTLYAGGGEESEGDHPVPVFAWAEGGHGVGRAVTERKFYYNIFRVLPLRDGSILATSTRPEIALFDATGKLQAEWVPIRGDLGILYAQATVDGSTLPLRLSRDSSLVEWTFQESRQRFDAAALTLEADHTEPAPGLAGWTAEAPGLHVTDWFQSEHPQLNGTPLSIEGTMYSVDAKHGRLLFGTNGWLRLVDANGKKLWNASAASACFRVNQSPDGLVMVAGYADGTIRWYRAIDGIELMALFVTNEKQHRWVAFTPSGYYAAGPGGEDLIGWHINRGFDHAADFFPAARFRDRFNRPDIVQLVLETLDETEALHRADAERPGAPTPDLAEQIAGLRADLPPVVTIVLPRDGAPLPSDRKVVIVAEFRSPSGKKIHEVFVRVDGRPPKDEPSLIHEPLPIPSPAPGETAELRIISVDLGEVPRTEVTVQVFAVDEKLSTPAALRLAAPAASAPSSAAAKKPRLLAVVAGVSTYEREDLRLRFAAKDAEDFAAALLHQEGHLYREVVVKPLIENEVRRVALLDALEWLEREATENSTAVLFLAGHGVTSKEQEYFFLPVNGNPDRPDDEGLSSETLKRHLKRISARVVTFLDTCYAGAVVGGGLRPSWTPDMSGAVNRLSDAEAGIAVYSATTGTTRALDNLPGLENGVFTYALLKALRTPVDGRAGQAISFSDLWNLLFKEVTGLTDRRQEPTFVTVKALPDRELFSRID